MTTALQLDLFAFGEVERGQKRRAEWLAHFEQADWIAPWDCADGTPAGTAVRGWRCPDPDCGKVEPSAFVLSINHGLDPHVPDSLWVEPWCRSLAIRYKRIQRGEPPRVPPGGPW